jgi:hypothetical protein
MRAPPLASLALALVVLAACSGGEGGGADGGGGGGGNAAKSCVDIRRCTLESPCLDEGCVTTCKQGGSTAAIAAFDALEQCLLGPAMCMRNDPNFLECLCKAECREEYTCETQLEACLAGVVTDQACNLCF